MVQERAPRVDWRRLRAGDTAALPERPRPPYLERRSTSEGDMRRGSYRESAFPDHFTLTAVNDDGTPIAEGTEALLGALLVEMRGVKAILQELLNERVRI